MDHRRSVSIYNSEKRPKALQMPTQREQYLFLAGIRTLDLLFQVGKALLEAIDVEFNSRPAAVSDD